MRLVQNIRQLWEISGRWTTNFSCPISISAIRPNAWFACSRHTFYHSSRELLRIPQKSVGSADSPIGNDAQSVVTISVKTRQTFYLETLMQRPEYARIKISNILQEFIDKYDLTTHTYDGWVYFCFLKGFYGLPNAGKLANDCSEKLHL